MIARRLALTVVVSLCAVVCALVVGAGVAVAASQFGSYGSEVGQLSYPTGVAVGASGDVYVGDTQNSRVDKFDGSGGFQLAWGEGVVDGALEAEVCTTFCRAGL